jgi:hypothetical protein
LAASAMPRMQAVRSEVLIFGTSVLQAPSRAVCQKDQAVLSRDGGTS